MSEFTALAIRGLVGVTLAGIGVALILRREFKIGSAALCLGLSIGWRYAAYVNGWGHSRFIEYALFMLSMLILLGAGLYSRYVKRRADT